MTEDFNEKIERELYEENNIITFAKDVEQDTVTELINKILAISLEGEEDIIIYLDTYGGDAYDIIRLYDCCKGIKNKTHFVVQSRAFSAGAYMMACCATGDRTANKNSTFMVHEISTFVGGKLKDVDIDTKEAKRLQSVLEKLLFKYTKLDKKQIRAMCVKDTYFTSHQAKKWGFIDKVI